MIKIKLRGGLGNQMFGYATCRSIAEKHGYDYYIIPNYFPDIHSSIIDTFNDLNMGKSTIPTHNIIHCVMPVDQIINCGDYTELNGYFQDDKLFDYNEINVKKWFTNIKLSEKEQFILNTILLKYDPNNWCYIHIRGGDWPFAFEKDYYDKSMKYIKDKFNIHKFLIITNDIELTKKYYNDENIVILDEYSTIKFTKSTDTDKVSNNYTIDLKLMTLSKYIIISSSTFSYWGGWLSDAKIIISPSSHLSPKKSDKFYYI